MLCFHSPQKHKPTKKIGNLQKIRAILTKKTIKIKADIGSKFVGLDNFKFLYQNLLSMTKTTLLYNLFLLSLDICLNSAWQSYSVNLPARYTKKYVNRFCSFLILSLMLSSVPLFIISLIMNTALRTLFW